jgi:DHA1 family bicyclomycin/chloramphenicol resistance-like MFS transporter
MPISTSSVWFTILLGILLAFTPLGTDTFALAMPTIARELGAAPAAVQFGITTFFLGIAGGQLGWGPISDRFGRRPALLAGCTLFLLASLFCAAAGSVTEIVALRFVQGLGMSSGPVIARSIVRDLYTRERAARLLAQMIVVFSFVPIFGPLLSAGLLTWRGWPAVFGLHALVAALVIATTLFGLKETAPSARASINPLRIAANFVALLVDRRFLAPIATTLCTLAGIYAFVSNSAFALVQGAGVTTVQYSMLFAVVMVGGIVGAWLSSQLVGRLGIPRLVRIGTAIAAATGLAVGLLAWLGVSHWAALIIPMTGYMFATSFILPNVTAAALSPFPQMAGAASSLIGAITFALGALISAVLGELFDGTVRPLATTVAIAGLSAFVVEAVLASAAAARPREEDLPHGNG